MKKLLLILIVNCSVFCFAQTIPNAGFETWQPYSATYTVQVPQHWWTVDLFQYAFNPSYQGLSVSKTTQSHSGNSAALFQTVINAGDTVSGLAFSSDSAGLGSQPQGFPFSSRSSSITGYYKSTLIGGDSIGLFVVMTKWNGNHRDTLVQESFFITSNKASYTQFSFPLSYVSNSSPDTAYILTGIFGPNGANSHVGTQFFLDDLAFSGAAPTGIQQIAPDPELISFYPNPFSTKAVINIKSSVNLNDAEIRIYDISGKEIKKISNITSQQATINREGMDNGIYFYKLVDKETPVSSGKFIIQ